MKTRLILILLVLSLFSLNGYSCTAIVVGKKATVDGSVIISHTDCGPDSRIRYVPAMDFKKGEMTNVYWGITLVNDPLDLNNYGEVIGQIPQVEHTYAYFHSAYSHMNEHQLAIGESTISQREELRIIRKESKQIMTVEQAQIFALQRCRTAKDALKLITSLMDKYGFLPSCAGESETLIIGDPNEAWVLEIYSVGPGWTPESGEPGALWVAQRVPDDNALIIPNWSIVKQINTADTENFMVSSNYMDIAVKHGWYNPNDNKPFIWQDVFSPTPREWATSRFWLFYSSIAPNYFNWPKRNNSDPFKQDDQYTQYVEPISIYPFSVKPEKKLSVQDIMKFQRSTFTGTIYDKENAPGWYVPGKDNKMVKSPMATPFPQRELRQLLKINSRRNVARARGEYGMIAQLRSWLPDEVGGIYWVFLDNAYTSIYMPIYTGATDVADCYKIYDKNHFDNNSMRWCIDFVDNLMYLKWQDAHKDLLAERNILEKSYFDEQNNIDKKAIDLCKKSPKKAKKYLTKLTVNRMNKAHQMFIDLRYKLITKYTNNKRGA